MNTISVSITPNGTVAYPLHSHAYWEIMYYLEGRGCLATAQEEIPFEKGSIIAVPPQVTHGSRSENGFVNISIGGDFQHLLLFDKPVLLKDTAAAEGETLARLILQNRYAENDYLSALCTAYVHFLLQNAVCESNLNRAVTDIIRQIGERFSDPDLDVTALLQSSGYAEDYMRAAFKKSTSLTPVAFLTKTRIDHARRLLEIYGVDMTMAELAEACGFTDNVWFSKRFKQVVGMSPNIYRKRMRR